MGTMEGPRISPTTASDIVYKEAKLHIGRFFYENGLYFEAANSASFKSIITLFFYENGLDSFTMTSIKECRLTRSTRPVMIRYLKKPNSISVELQRLAIRVLSQTCDGASKFELRRSLAETVVSKGRNEDEQKMVKGYGFPKVQHAAAQFCTFDLVLA